MLGEDGSAIEAHVSAFGGERGDEALDLGRWQVVTGDAVRLAEIAADDEAAQAGAGQALRLRDAEPADHLYRRSRADSLEDGAGRGTEHVARDQGRVGSPGVGLQVDSDAVHTSLEHGQRDLD